MRWLIALLLPAAPTWASGDTIPVPEKLVRELTADRPQVTESPFTVEVGAVQLELDFFVYARDSGLQGTRKTRLRTFTLLPFTLKVGVLDNLDVEVSYQPLVFQRLEVFDPTTSVEREGFGTIVFSVKINLFGNDGGDTALGIIPWLKLPSSQDELDNEDFEGGVIVPFFLRLNATWVAGAKLEVDAVRDTLDTEYVAAFVGSVYVRRNEVLRRVDVYVEFFARITTQDGLPWEGAIHLGVIWQVADAFTLDFGGSVALTSAAENSRIWVGATIRF
jgi:hypothetical protein